MTKKLTWEVDKTSLVLRVTDGDIKTEWKVRKNHTNVQLSEIFLHVFEALVPVRTNTSPRPSGTLRPMAERVRTVDAEELAELQRHKVYPEPTEEASRAAQAARVAQLNVGAKWFEADEDDTYGVSIPDYDTGEIQ